MPTADITGRPGQRIPGTFDWVCCHVSLSAERSPSWLLSLIPQIHQAQLPEAVSFPFHGLMHQLEVDLLTCWPVIHSVSRHRVKGAPQNPAPNFGHIPQWQKSSFPSQRGHDRVQAAPAAEPPLWDRRVPWDAVAPLHGAAAAHVGGNWNLQKTLVLTKLFLQFKH